MQLETLIQRYLAEMRGKFRVKTVKSYTERLSRFGVFLAQEKVKTLSELSTEAMSGYPNRLEGLSVNSRYVYLHSAQQFCAWLTENHFVFFNPGQGLALPKWERTRRVMWSEEQIKRRLKKITEPEPLGSRDKALLGLPLLEGLSFKELASLTVLDVDISGKKLRRTTKKKFQILQTVSITILREWLRQRGLCQPQTDFLFITAKGVRLDTPSIRRIVEGIKR
jgi:site-specific recombinase XerC